MKKILLLAIILNVLFTFETSAQVCNASGNVVIYTNYDGGFININCDQNIPNLKIGITTYENAQINITGPFAGNVTEVIYAGFQGGNDNCNQGINSTNITGVPANITSVLFAPAGVISNPEGYPSIICAYSCGSEWQGGCNTADEIIAYFLNAFGGGTLRTYLTQYNCWQGDTYNVSESECCSIPTTPLVANFSISDPIVCLGQCIQFTDQSSENPTSWTWSFEGTNVTSSTTQNPTNICYNELGTHYVTLTASNAEGSDSYTTSVQVISCGNPGCTYSNASNYNMNATVDDGSCTFLPCATSCPADLNNDSSISVADLIIFIALYGTICPN